MAGIGQLFAPFLALQEEIRLACANVRDRMAFTDKKIIAYNVRGFTETKEEFSFFPYSKITSFSVETAGVFHFNSDFKIWISGAGCLEIKFGQNWI